MLNLLSDRFNDRPAIIVAETGETVTYSDLKARIEEIQNQWSSSQQKKLIFLFAHQELKDIIIYLAALASGHAICLLDKELKLDFKLELISRYQPDFIYYFSDNTLSGNYIPSQSFLRNSVARSTQIHPDLQLLLTTSGTTGSPKLIRLTKKNILANAASIVEYLELTERERAPLSLPLHYSYGLSVLNSHLLAGATLILTQTSLMQDSFWQTMQDYLCTSLAGVPYFYKMLDIIKFETFDLPHLLTLTQAGGPLDKASVLKYQKLMEEKKGRFFVMYGQTEATARIAYLPTNLTSEHPDSIGIAIPGGSLHIYQIDNQDEIVEPRQQGELVYKGANVMMGYAETADDLAKGDELNGVLRTGDIAYFDEEKLFYITGRLKRISKVYGLRISLDDIEKELSSYGNIAATTTDFQINVYIEKGDASTLEKCLQHLSHAFQLHPTTFNMKSIEILPRMSSGKIDYQKL